jgi:hypothetical protein
MNNFNLNANAYYAYMRAIAAENENIGADNPAKNLQHFYQGELEEFYKGLRSKVEFPALVVEGFSLHLSFEHPSLKHRESAFTVIYPYSDDDDYRQITECFSKSENVGLEILRKMATDGANVPCQIRIEDISGVQVLNERDRYAGIRFSFSVCCFV